MSLLRRIAASVAALVLTMSAPGLVGIAHADDDELENDVSLELVLTPAQVTAVTAARADYLKTAWQAKIVYRTAVLDARDAMDATLQTPRLNVLLAKDAYEVAVRFGGDVTGTRAALDASISAYRTAYASALATARASTDAARATLRTTLTNARATYIAAITAVFAGTTVPESLLNPPGPRMGWYQDHGGWKGLFKEFGISERFDLKWPSGMRWAWGND